MVQLAPNASGTTSFAAPVRAPTCHRFRLTTTFRVDVFFKFHPHAHRLFHRPTFLTCLSLPPSHSKFPSSAVLHAISAIGSLYTAAVTSPPRPTFEEFPPGNLMAFQHNV